MWRFSRRWRNADREAGREQQPIGRALWIRLPQWHTVLFLAVGMALAFYLDGREARPPKPRAKSTVAALAGPIRSVAVSPDGRILAAVGWHHLMRHWVLATGWPPSGTDENIDRVYCMAFAPDG